LWQLEADTEAASMRSPRLPRPEPPSPAQAAASNSASQEDLREYLAFLDDTNLTEAQKIEQLQTLWSIMSAFVDLAFGTDPVQQALPSITASQDRDDSIVSAVKPAERE
jgi:hypothetical protein